MHSRRFGKNYFSCIFGGYYFKGNWHDLFSCIFVGYYFKGNQQDLFSAHSSVTISKVIGKIYFSCIFAGYHFKGNRHDLFSCIFVGYYFKGNWQDLFSAHSSVTISKVINRIYFQHIRRLLFQR